MRPSRRSVAPLELELLSSSGPPRLRIRPTRLRFETYQNQAHSLAQGQSTRLGEIITRLGEICLSQHVAQAMLGEDTNCYPHAILSAMATPDAIQNKARINQRLTQLLQDCLPPPTVVSKPTTVCAWRLEPPTRVCLFTGQPPKILADNFAPHTLPKTLLKEERSKRPAPSGIHLVPGPPPTVLELAPRAALLRYAQTALVPHYHKRCLDTTLEEAAACLVLAPRPDNHTRTGLNQSAPWEQDHIDNRYDKTPHTLKKQGLMQRSHRCSIWTWDPGTSAGGAVVYPLQIEYQHHVQAQHQYPSASQSQQASTGCECPVLM